MEKETKWIPIIFMFVSLVCFGHGNFTINTPTSHMALSNVNVTVRYTTPGEQRIPTIYIELIDIDTNRSILVRGITSPSVSGTLVYPCNIFVNESKLMFLLKDENYTVIAHSETLVVHPPFVDVVQPSPQMYTLDGSVVVSIYMNLENGLCQSCQCELFLNVSYHRYNDSKSEQIHVYSTRLDYEDVAQVVVGCEYLDTAGFYTFEVVTEAGKTIGTSAAMELLWNSIYRVNVQSPSISECQGNGILIDYKSPACGSSDDKIRVYAQIGSYSETPDPIGNMKYIIEIDIPNEREDTIIDCSSFHGDVNQWYNGYCFFYISVTRNRAVHQQTHTCVPYNYSNIATPGGWSEWGEWSRCTATCGTASHHRTRGCENPPPSNGGATCVGDYVETGTCNVDACPTVELNEALDTAEEDSCGCGCVMRSPSGTIDAYAKECDTQVTWLIQVERGYRINITFKSFDLSSSGRFHEYLRIHDGRDSSAPVLLFLTGTRLPVPLLSTGEAMLMEYQIYRSNSYRHGFFASFNSSKKENVTLTTRKLAIEEQTRDQFSGDTIMIMGIVMCVAVIIVTMTAVAYAYLKSGVIRGCGRNIKPRIKSSEFIAPSEQDTCSPVHRAYKNDASEDMDDRGNPDGKVCDRSQMYLAKEDRANSDSAAAFPRRLISVESDDCRKDPLGQDQFFTGVINGALDDRFPDGHRNRYSFSDSSSRLQDLQIKFTMRDSPAGYSRQTSLNSLDSSNTLPPNFQFSAPYINREGNLTPLGFAISRSLSLNHDKDASRKNAETNHKEDTSQSTSGISRMLPETHLVNTCADVSAKPAETNVVVHSEHSESVSTSPNNRVPRKLPITPRPAFYEFQVEEPNQEQAQRATTPTRKIPKIRGLKANKNAVMTINEEPCETQTEEKIDSDTTSPQESVASPMSLTRESPPGGPVRRLKQKAAKRQRKSTECLSSAESEINSMRLSAYSASSQDCMWSDDQPSPIRKYDIHNNKQMWQQVFISDESLARTLSGNEDGSAKSSPTRRHLPETPTKRLSSPNNNQFPSNPNLMYSDITIYQEPDEMEFDNYMPNLPGSYFEGSFNYPSADLNTDMDLFEGLEISKV